MTDATLKQLARLVAFDTRNPPRALREGDPVFDYLRAQFAGFSLRQWDHGDGSISLLAQRGAPRTLFNFHLDTVPVADGWQRDPFTLCVEDKRAYGLGSCDIKGALAAMLAACAQTKGDVAVLVTSDEEAGQSVCVKEFLATDPDYAEVFVAEPTMCRAVVSHRGVISAGIDFDGVTGHASSPAALEGSAIHRAMRFGSAALAAVAGRAPHADTELRDVRLNIGLIQGGVKPNMIAAHCSLALNMRTRPAQDQQAVIDCLLGLAATGDIGKFTPRFVAPPLPDAAHGEAALVAARAMAGRYGVDVGDSVDFWTEAALFGAAGFTTVVLGSGDIAQAHTADEWVTLDQLATLTGLYTRMIDDG